MGMVGDLQSPCFQFCHNVHFDQCVRVYMYVLLVVHGQTDQCVRVYMYVHVFVSSVGHV